MKLHRIVLASALAALAAGLSSVAHAEPAAAASVEDEVKAVTQRACDAFLRADSAALEELLAPEFTLVDSR